MADDLMNVQFLTVGEVCDLLRVSDMTVHRLIQAGDLSAVRVGRQYRIHRQSVIELLAKDNEPPA